jgi:hypothetical protein
MSGCDFVDAQGNCATLRDASNVAIDGCSQANERIAHFNRLLGLEQLDLFNEAPTSAAAHKAEWHGIHAACAREYKRLTRSFWQGCTHG